MVRRAAGEAGDLPPSRELGRHAVHPLAAFQRLIDNGGSLVIIEHNLDVIKAADWIIDLGPEGGGRGGELVAVGTPEAIAEASGSHTGRYLREVL